MAREAMVSIVQLSEIKIVEPCDTFQYIFHRGRDAVNSLTLKHQARPQEWGVTVKKCRTSHTHNLFPGCSGNEFNMCRKSRVDLVGVSE